MSYLDIAKIRRDGGTQPRVGIIQETVAEYAEAMLAGDEFPPVIVFHDGTDYWLADGFHRALAGIVAGIEEIRADIRMGTLRDAVLFSAGANATHGARRTNEDKRHAVKLLLLDPEWSQWSDREIARKCRVHHDLVGQMRKTVSGGNRQIGGARKVTRNGTTYEQNTSNIGRAKPEYIINETGGETKQGFTPENPNMAYTDPATGEVLHHPWSEEKQKERREKSHFALDLTDHLKWIIAVTKSQVDDKVLPRNREEVDGLLSTAAAHLRNLVGERNQPHVTSEKCIE